MRKYSKKYSGAQLELKVREYLYQKGFMSECVNIAFDEVEDE